VASVAADFARFGYSPDFAIDRRFIAGMDEAIQSRKIAAEPRQCGPVVLTGKRHARIRWHDDLRS
jgi:hypothetical protein